MIADWPAVVAVGCFEMLARLIRGPATAAVEVTEPVTVSAGESTAPAGVPEVESTAPAGLHLVPDDEPVAVRQALTQDAPRNTLPQVNGTYS